MKKRIVVTLAALAISATGLAGCKKESPQQTEAPQTAPAPAATTPPAPAPEGTEKTGEQLYKQYCAACHPDGGNTMKPKKTLHAKSLADSKITTPEDIEKVMRNPGPGMTKFDEATIPDKEAKMIGEYVLTTFK